MENFTRVSDSIRMNKSLTASEKLFIGYLQTYQLSPDGTPTNNYCFLKQEELAEELGESLSTIKRMIISLSSKGIIFQSAARNYNKSGYQFKNRKATIFVDKYNVLPTELEVAKEAPKSIKPKVEVVVPEPIKEVVRIKELTIEDELEDRALPLVIQDKYSLDDSLNLYEFIPEIYEGTTDEKCEAAMYFIHNITSTPTMKEFASFLSKTYKEQRYNDYYGPKIELGLINKVKTLIK